MCQSQCSASALLLQNNYASEAAIILRSIEELLFDIHWIMIPKDREERLGRVYKLEADPLARWVKETNLIAKKYSVEKGKLFRGPIDEIAAKNTYLTEINLDGIRTFKTLDASLADRMGESLRPKYYHVYCYGSLFTHPTPFIKDLYLKTSNSDHKGIETIEESHRQFIAYSLLFTGLIIDYVEEILGSFSPSGKEQREALRAKMIQLIEKANKEYFRNPLKY
jgi:hypothetical protein